MASGAKQYGLILPTKKGVKKELKTGAVFGSAAQDNESIVDDKAAERRRVAHEAARSFHQSKVQRTHEKALAEDASVFDYDGVYDQIQSSRQDKKAQHKAQREAEKQKPKYITALIEKAKVREIENERIRERRLLREREAEDAEFGDKEKLISASYKRKLQEMQRWDEEDRRMEAVEAAEDVTKRGADAMAGFYSNLLTKNLAMGGSASNSRSAYTVGKTEHNGAKYEDKQATADPEPARITSQQKTEVQDTVVPRSSNPESLDQRAKSETTSAPASRTAEQQLPNKEKIVSAARARFLARKAAKLQPNA